MNRVAPVPETLQRTQRLALLIGLLAIVPCAAGAYWRPDQFFTAYLIAFLYVWMIAAGCLAISMLHHMTGGDWGLPIRPLLVASSGTLPLLGVLSVPILFNLPSLYLWARPEEVAADVHLQHKAAYLNISFFQLRTALYFACWLTLDALLNWVSSRPIRDPDRADERRQQTLPQIGGAGIVVWGLTVTFAAIDWGMSLEPLWMSSLYGVLFMSGQAVSALSFVLIAVILLRHTAYISQSLTIARMHDLGNFLMAFTLFWIYITFTQFIVIWSGNLPEETPWYLNRSTGGWQILGTLIIGLQFALPFLLLLSRATKRNSGRLMAVSILLLTMRLVDLYWLILPASSPGKFVVNWMLPFTLLATGGLWLAAFIRKLGNVSTEGWPPSAVVISERGSEE